MPTKIEWTEEVWNVVTGCTKVSPGCANCYAEAMCRRFWRQWDRDPPPDHFQLKLHHRRFQYPLRWRKPRRVFVCSMSDLFHEDIEVLDATFLRDVFAVMALCPEHTFQVLTKRAHVLPLWLTEDFADGVEWSANVHAHFRGARYHQPEFRWPLPNVWLGVTAEDQKRADSRIPDLLRTKAAVRFVSLEPLLQPVYLHQVALAHGFVINSLEQNTVGRCGRIEKWKPLDWIIIGAESGPNRRPMELEWAIDLVRQCQAAGVACFVKQIPVNGKVSKDLNEWPEELRVREYPR